MFLRFFSSYIGVIRKLSYRKRRNQHDLHHYLSSNVYGVYWKKPSIGTVFMLTLFGIYFPIGHHLHLLGVLKVKVQVVEGVLSFVLF